MYSSLWKNIAIGLRICWRSALPAELAITFQVTGPQRFANLCYPFPIFPLGHRIRNLLQHLDGVTHRNSVPTGFQKRVIVLTIADAYHSLSVELKFLKSGS